MLDDVGEGFLPELRRKVEDKLKINGNNILVNASHTHPPGKLLCNDDEQVKRVFGAIEFAVNNMVEVKLGVGKGREDRITVNRTLRLKNGKHWSVRHSNPCPPDEEVESLGPLDNEIGIIRIDRLDGSPMAVIYNFAFHLLFGDAAGSITANIPAYASKVIEETLGGGATAFFIQGAAGDVIDINFKDFSYARDIDSLGSLLGRSVLEAYRDIKTDTVDINMVSDTIKVPRRIDFDDRVNELVAEQQRLLSSLAGTTLNFKTFLPMYLQYSLNPDFPLHYSYKYMQEKIIGSNEIFNLDMVNRNNVDKYLKNIYAMEKLARIEDKISTLRKHQKVNEESGEDTIDMEVQAVRIGESVIVTSTAELLVEIGLNIKKMSSFENTLIAAYSNGYVHYGAPAEYYDKGGYEVTECLLAPEWQKIYEDKVRELLGKV
jgi:hypothetical protein